uniref:Uncharacterized protein n=1 Tax=Globodera rostochiensis TaxID=31243 RepID=A0A914HSY5_GLORO
MPKTLLKFGKLTNQQQQQKSAAQHSSEYNKLKAKMRGLSVVRRIEKVENDQQKKTKLNNKMCAKKR